MAPGYLRNTIMNKEKVISRERFARTLRFLTPLRAIVSDSFGQRGARDNFNRAVSYCLSWAFDATAMSGELEPAKVLLSNGSLEGVKVPEMQVVDNRILVHFDASVRINGNADDQVHLCVYAPELGIADRTKPEFRRSQAQLTFKLIRALQGVRVLVYLYCCTRNGNVYSRSQFLGCVGKEGTYVAG